ncbi:MAG: hypothetical protein WBG94_11595 [Anaerolineales bacterium]
MTVENEMLNLENPKEMENLASENEKLAEEMGAELKIRLDDELEG